MKQRQKQWRLMERGQSLNEYVLLTALVGGVVVFSLQGLGNTVSNSFVDTSSSLVPDTGASKGSLKAEAERGGQQTVGPSGIPASGSYALAFNDGQLEISATTSGATTTSSSGQIIVEGVQPGTLGNLKQVSYLEALATQYAGSQPAVASHIQKLAETGYYLSATQAEFDELNAYKDLLPRRGADPYDNITALSDMARLQKQLLELRNAPPPEMQQDPGLRAVVEMLSAGIQNNTQTYLDKILTATGGEIKKVNTGEDKNGQTGGLLGMKLEVAHGVRLDPRAKTVEQLFPLDKLRSLGTQLLATDTQSLAISTYQNAQTLDRTATHTDYPSPTLNQTTTNVDYPSQTTSRTATNTSTPAG